MSKEFKKIKIENLIEFNYRDEQVEDLMLSMITKGQLDEVKVTPLRDEQSGEIINPVEKFVIVDGNRRKKAAEQIVKQNAETSFSFNTLDCVVDTEINYLSEDFKLNQVIYNEVHKMSGFAQYIVVKDLAASGKYSYDQISKALGKKDHSWASKITKLVLDDNVYRTYFSGNHLFYLKDKNKYFSNIEDLEKYVEVLTEDVKAKIYDFIDDKNNRTLKEYLKARGMKKISEEPALASLEIYKGFGKDNAPSIWNAKPLVEFYNKYCTGEDKDKGMIYFYTLIKYFMAKNKKGLKDIEDAVKRMIENKIEPEQNSGDNEPQEKIVKNPKSIARSLYNVIKNVKIDNDQLNEIRREMRAIIKNNEYSSMFDYEIKIIPKKRNDNKEEQ